MLATADAPTEVVSVGKPLYLSLRHSLRSCHLPRQREAGRRDRVSLRKRRLCCPSRRGAFRRWRGAGRQSSFSPDHNSKFSPAFFKRPQGLRGRSPSSTAAAVEIPYTLKRFSFCSFFSYEREKGDCPHRTIQKNIIAPAIMFRSQWQKSIKIEPTNPQHTNRISKRKEA